MTVRSSLSVARGVWIVASRECAGTRVRAGRRVCACVRVDACILNHSLCEHNTPHSSCRADCDSLTVCAMNTHARTRSTDAQYIRATKLLLMLLPRRAVVHPRGGTQLEGGVGDRRAGSLSSADAASRLGGGSCFAARVAKRRTRLRSAAAALSERAGRAAGLHSEGAAKTDEKRKIQIGCYC